MVVKTESGELNLFLPSLDANSLHLNTPSLKHFRFHHHLMWFIFKNIQYFLPWIDISHTLRHYGTVFKGKDRRTSNYSMFIYFDIFHSCGISSLVMNDGSRRENYKLKSKKRKKKWVKGCLAISKLVLSQCRFRAPPYHIYLGQVSHTIFSCWLIV